MVVVVTTLKSVLSELLHGDDLALMSETIEVLWNEFRAV